MTIDDGRRYGRRTVLKASGAALAASAAAGCLGGVGGGNGTTKPAEITEFPVSDVESKFNLWNWYDGLASYAQEQMPKQYDGLETVNVSGYSSSSQWYAKLQSGNHDIDSVASITSFTAKGIADDLLEPLPVDALPNYDNAMKRARDAMSAFTQDGQQYAVPHVIGLWPTLGYSSNHFDSPPDSWGALWDPELKGRITMQDQPTVSGFVAARYTGQDFTDPSDFQDIKEALLQQKPLVKTYWKEYSSAMQMFINESVLAGTQTMGRLYAAHFQHDAPHVNYSIPEEGNLMFIDQIVVPKGAPHPRIATEFIHWFLKPDNAIQLFLTMGYLPPMADLSSLMKEHGVGKEKREFVTWSKEEQERLIFWEPLADDVRQKYNQIWTEVKAA